MAANTFGTRFRLTTFGESHGPMIGGIIDGCPSGLALDLEAIQAQMQRRRPGQSALTTPRDEADQVEFVSGIFEGLTTGTPIGFLIKNKDQRSRDYSNVKDSFRPSHADFTYSEKYGRRDYRGGGRSSARETASRVAAGALAAQLLDRQGICIVAYVSQVGSVICPSLPSAPNQIEVDQYLVRCPHSESAAQMQSLIEDARDTGNTIGGKITCIITGVPAGWGEPVFDKLHAVLGHAILSINACKAFEIGSGTQAAFMNGSDHNDAFVRAADGSIQTTSNNSGGVQGGISNGMPIVFYATFKPVATIQVEQQTVNSNGEQIKLKVGGRHDPCVLPRAVPIVEAMAALTLADMMLLQRSQIL